MEFDTLYIKQFEAIQKTVSCKDYPKILDLGIGKGMVWEKNRKIIPSNWQIYGVDISSDIISLLRNDWALDQFHFEKANADSMPYEDEEFDLVCAFNSLNCFADIKSSIIEVFRVLKKGGCLVTSFVYPTNYAQLVKQLNIDLLGFDSIFRKDSSEFKQIECEISQSFTCSEKFTYVLEQKIFTTSDIVDHLLKYVSLHIKNCRNAKQLLWRYGPDSLKIINNMQSDMFIKQLKEKCDDFFSYNQFLITSNIVNIHNWRK